MQEHLNSLINNIPDNDTLFMDDDLLPLAESITEYEQSSEFKALEAADDPLEILDYIESGYYSAH